MKPLHNIQRNISKATTDAARPGASSPPPPSPSSSTTTPAVVPVAAKPPPNGIRSVLSYEALQQYYKQFPDPAVSPDLHVQQQHITSLCNSLAASLPDSACAAVDRVVNTIIPSGLDQSMYTIRCACELSVQRLTQISQQHHHEHFAPLHPVLTSIADMFDAFQQGQSTRVSQLVADYLPKDFRAHLFNAARHQSEQSNANAVKQLLANGGSIEDKYALLWKQQFKRRETLASVGNASGIWKWVVKHLAGVPEALLQFAKEINAPKGPTEALREKFGPALQLLLTFAQQVNACTLAMRESSTEVDHEEIFRILDQGLAVYKEEVSRFLDGLHAALADSPFFVTPDQIPISDRQTPKSQS